jgi:exodeoxyribonuclease III
VNIATWNVNGVRAREAQLVEWVTAAQPDVLCLQETKAALDQLPPSLRALEGYWSYWHGQKGYSGVALLARRARFPVEPRFEHPPFDHETRIVVAQLDGVLVASIYVPNGGKDFPAKMRFLSALDEYARAAKQTGQPLVLCGDLNVARTDRDVHAKERKPGLIGQRPDERALLEQLLGRGLCDLGRAVAPDDDGLFTWWAPWRNLRQRNIGWRLDYVAASEAMAARASACVVLRDVGTSDHAPVVATFAD